jgi:asparagine synthase (glutamine-hydrolysing)
MLDALVHRGPDAAGVFEAPGVVAGIRRLRVVDLESGDQPIANEDGTVEVVFNGEIYNHRDLRRQLEAKGHRFRTLSDTEVLVHLWEEYGPRMVARLDGMFAFCVADRRKGEVFLARDPLGIKPLYLKEEGSRIAFASETSALRRLPQVRLDPDPGGLFSLLAMQYVPGEATLFRGVTRLPPGGTLHLRDGGIRRGGTALPPPTDEPIRCSEAEEAETFRELFREAVRRQREADVPVGVFLSGGLDSTAVAWTLARETPGKVESFSVGFESPGDLDERRWARLAAERVGTKHHELVVTAEDVARVLPEAEDHLEEPVSDPAFLPTWILSKFAKERVTVVLTGEGADELLGGYRRHLYQQRYGWLGRVPGFSLGAGFAVRAGIVSQRAVQAAEALTTRDPCSRHRVWGMTLSPILARDLVEPPLWSDFLQTSERALEPFFRQTHGLEARLRADLGQWLPNLLLMKVDGATMAHSLEARVPFLSVDVVERALRWPTRLKIQGRETKRLLRRAFVGKIPDEILGRPKRGFDLPLDDWISGPLREMAEDVFNGNAWTRWPGIRPPAARALLRRHLEGRTRAGLPLFLLLSIGRFLERHG